MERLRQKLGDRAARDKLSQDAANIRGALPLELLDGLSTVMDIGPHAGARQKAYVAGNIVCRRYEVDGLPTEAVLRADLRRFIDLYEDAVEAKRRLLQQSPGSIASASGAQTAGAAD